MGDQLLELGEAGSQMAAKRLVVLDAETELLVKLALRGGASSPDCSGNSPA